MHFVASRKLNDDTIATISELPVSFPSLWVEPKTMMSEILSSRFALLMT